MVQKVGVIEKQPTLAKGTLTKALMSLLLVTSWSFTLKQKEWIKRRDKECLLKRRGEIVCSDPKYDEIDHLTPQGISYERIKLTEDQADSPLNGGRLCRNHHRGHPKSKHPDAHVATWTYREKNGNTFQALRQSRHQLLVDGKIYWNDDEGDYLAALIRRRTIEYVLAHPDDPFPRKNGKNSKH